VHTPWVGPGEFRRLPDTVSHGTLRGLLAADVVAFSSPLWCRGFMRCAEDFLGARRDGDEIVYEGRRTRVLDFVLGVDEDDLASSAAAEPAREAGKRLDARGTGRKMLLRVDRTDLSKNILRGLLAFELMLERHPEHRDGVWHYCNLNPSRQSVPEYRRYLDACRAATERIAERFGAETITLEVGDDYPGVVAALQRYDVLLTNPVIDGTNLVAKEGASLNARDGVLVLSRSAGAAGILGDGALLVNPYDVEETAEALHSALVMDDGERRARNRRLKAAARRGAPADWLDALHRHDFATIERRMDPEVFWQGVREHFICENRDEANS
jgi:trehalose 6-phosphate synthase